MAESSLENSPTMQALHLQSLIIQHEHLLFVSDRHVQWAGEARDPQIRSMHIGLAERLEQAARRLEQLIQTLQRDSGPE